MKQKILTVLFFFCVISIFAEIESEISAEEVPLVNIETFPEKPVYGRPWTVTILINHSTPNEVDVLPPPFLGISLDRFAKMTRTIEGQLWTTFEYRFNINTFGQIVLEPFKVITPQNTIETNPIILEIAVPAQISKEQRKINLRIVWDVPSQIFQGEKTTLSIRITNINSAHITALPSPEFFMPQVPQGVILALMPISSSDRAAGIVAKFNLIPLYTGDFKLPARVLHHDNYIFEIPAFSMKILEKPNQKR